MRQATADPDVIIRKATKIKLLPGERQPEFVIKEEPLKDILAH